MKKKFTIPLSLLYLFGLLFLIGTIAISVKTTLSSDFETNFSFDFGLRHNEIACILSGVNPYDISDGSVSSREFCSWIPNVASQQVGKRAVGGYPPWEYTIFSPMYLFPMRIAFFIFIALEIVAICLCCRFAFVFARRCGIEGGASFFVAFSPLLLFYQMSTCIKIGNFGILLGCILFILADCLEKKRHIAAGICLSLLMIKPHLSIFALIPLILDWKNGCWKTIVTSGAICGLASFPASILVKRSPISLALDVFLRHASQPFRRVAFLPQGIADRLLDTLTAQGFISLSFALFGIAILYVSVKLRHSCWLVRLVPVAVFAPVWGYWQVPDTCMFILPATLAFTFAFLGRKPSEKCIAIMATASMMAGFAITRDLGRSRLPACIAWRLYELNVPVLKELGVFVLSLPEKAAMLYPAFVLRTWVSMAAFSMLLANVNFSAMGKSNVD